MLRKALDRYDALILAGDVGGTNTSLAVVGKRGDVFEIIRRFQAPTPALERFEDGLNQALEAFGTEVDTGEISLCCISGAGPVVDDECRLTNAPWSIRRTTVERITGVRTYLLNDFSAISYALPLVDRDNPDHITKLPGLDGRVAFAGDGIAAVVGAGTGLGVGFIVCETGRYRAWPSEGGHTDLAPYDDRTDALVAYLRSELGGQPDWEHVVSGSGIANVFGFLHRHEFPNHTGDVVDQILRLPVRERAAKVSEGSASDPLCRASMELFVDLYGRATSGVVLQLLPSAGVYLAGGIAPKNRQFFLEEHRFMRSFCQSFHAKFREILAETPVSIINDYEISLYGAAHAATVLDRAAAGSTTGG